MGKSQCRFLDQEGTLMTNCRAERREGPVGSRLHTAPGWRRRYARDNGCQDSPFSWSGLTSTPDRHEAASSQGPTPTSTQRVP